MRHLCSILFIITLALTEVVGQQTYSRVRFDLDRVDLREVAELGLPVDHGRHRPGVFFESTYSDMERQWLDAAGIPYTVLIEDEAAHVRQRTASPATKDLELFCGAEDTDPANFALGSMAGFFTYEEMHAHLDSMRSKYPHLIAARQPIDTFQTWEGRPIEWVRISNNPDVEQTGKTEVLYTALHHAREPGSLSQLIYFMWYLLENYDTDARARQIIDDLELFIVPCINPDGYVYNQTTDPGGGGMHRKNRRPTGGSNQGVDLNRNYSEGFAVSGASANPNSDVYHGPAPFSEPETRAIRHLVETHAFQLALNYHTFDGSLLFPWGYTDAVQCPDHDLFLDLTDFLTEKNGYANFQSSGLYPAGGDSDDWMYADTANKPKVLAMTPEMGRENTADGGFWPASDRILPICRLGLTQNLHAALSLLEFGRINDRTDAILPTTGFFRFDLERLGLDDSDYTVTLSIDGSYQGEVDITGPAYAERVADSIQYIATAGWHEFAVTVQTDRYEYLFSFRKFVTVPQVVFADNEADMAKWAPTDWTKTTARAQQGGYSMTDSELGDYPSDANNIAQVAQPIDLRNANVAALHFWGQWNIEEAWDHLVVEAAPAGTTDFEPLCGTLTNPGSAEQGADIPLYDDVRDAWRFETIDLSAWCGQEIDLRFRLVSDGFIERDGAFIDEIRVLKAFDEDGDNTAIGRVERADVHVFPNPASDLLHLTRASTERATYRIIDGSGRTVRSGLLPAGRSHATLSVGGLARGSYQLMIDRSSGPRFVVR